MSLDESVEPFLDGLLPVLLDRLLARWFGD